MLKYKIFSIIFFICGQCFAQLTNQEVEEIRNKQRVNYIYNFTKYITWENIEQKDNFRIVIIGERDKVLLKEFERTAEKKKIKGLPVSILFLDDMTQLDEVDILYIHKAYDVELENLLGKLYAKNALLVTEGYPFHESMINFIDIDDEFHFEVDESKINNARLLIDPALTSASIQSLVDWDNLYDRLKKEIKTVQNQQIELDKLIEEIEKQKSAIEEQEKKLQQTFEKLEEQGALLTLQKSEIVEQKNFIKNQLKKLDELAKNIKQQENVNKKLVETYSVQNQSLRNQEIKLLEQEENLIKNLAHIEAQKTKIDSQNSFLSKQLVDLNLQRIISIIAVAFVILAVMFIFFMLISNNKRKKSELALRQKNEELLVLNESLDNFTYHVSHDLKAPIVNIRSLIEMLNETIDEQDHPVLPELFSHLNISTDRMEATVLDMLKLTRIERIEEVKAETNLKEIVEYLKEVYKSDLEDISATFNTVSMKHEIVYASQVELNSIFQNLITNSIKYRSNKRDLQIDISTEIKDNLCLIKYSDNGRGIDLKRFEKKMFTMFQRFNADPEITGTGVGMYIIKKLITNNNGTIKLESSPDKGLTYIVTLPVDKM